MVLPFSYTYTIINNILTIVFDFSKLGYNDFYNLKQDYFSQGLVINETGYDMSFVSGASPIQTYKIELEDASSISLRLMGKKVREQSKTNDTEYAVKIYTVADIQEVIDDVQERLQKAQDGLDDLYAMAGKWVGKSASKGMSKREAKYKSEIHGNTVAMRFLKKEQKKISTPKFSQA
jgi:hypothetical protein